MCMACRHNGQCPGGAQSLFQHESFNEASLVLVKQQTQPVEEVRCRTSPAVQA